MAKGRQRIRQRGSRQQWAAARSKKSSDPIAPVDASADDAPAPGRLLPITAVASSLRCGGCGLIAEQRLRDSRRVIHVPYALCISCDELRCLSCWDADDTCPDGEEHEFLEIHYSAEGAPLTRDFDS